MTQFKVGDWIRHKYTQSIQQVTSANSETINGYPVNCYEPWQPKEGEWCWFYNKDESKSFILSQFLGMRGNGNFIDIEEYDWEYCEPFIGQLPSWIKETK